MFTHNALPDAKMVESKRNKLEKKATTETYLLILISSSHTTAHITIVVISILAVVTSLPKACRAANTNNPNAIVPALRPLR